MVRFETIVVSPSEQSRNRSPAREAIVNVSTSTSGSVPSAARDHRALRMALRFLRRQLAAAHELRDERVSSVSCSIEPSRIK